MYFELGQIRLSIISITEWKQHITTHKSFLFVIFQIPLKCITLLHIWAHRHRWAFMPRKHESRTGIKHFKYSRPKSIIGSSSSSYCLQERHYKRVVGCIVCALIFARIRVYHFNERENKQSFRISGARRPSLVSAGAGGLFSWRNPSHKSFLQKITI